MKFVIRWRKLHRMTRETIWLFGIVVVLAVIFAAAWFSDDREAPEIIFPEGTKVYVVGDGEDTLLEGVRAYDNKDGDITDRLVILQARMITQEEISVIYQVRDSSGNLTQESRTYRVEVVDPGPVTPPEGTETPPEGTSHETEGNPNSGETTEEYPTEENTELGVSEPSSEIPEETEPTDPVEPTEPPTEEVTDPAPVLTEIQILYIGPEAYEGYITSAADFTVNAIYSDGTVEEGVVGWGCAEVGAALKAGANIFIVTYEGISGTCTVEAAAQPVEEIPTVPVDPAAPVLIMKRTEVHVGVGEYFHYRTCIESITDDKDDQKTLYDRIRVIGWDTFTTQVPGVYLLTIYVVDTDRNTSAEWNLTVYVE